MGEILRRRMDRIMWRIVTAKQGYSRICWSFLESQGKGKVGLLAQMAGNRSSAMSAITAFLMGQGFGCFACCTILLITALLSVLLEIVAKMVRRNY